MRVEDSQNHARQQSDEVPATTHAGWAPPEYQTRPTTDAPDIAEVPGDEPPGPVPAGAREGHYDSGSGETSTGHGAEAAEADHPTDADHPGDADAAVADVDGGEFPPDDFSPDEPTGVDETRADSEQPAGVDGATYGHPVIDNEAGRPDGTPVDEVSSGEPVAAEEPAVGVASVPTEEPSDAPVGAPSDAEREPAEELAPGEVPDPVVAAFWELEVVDGYRDRWQQIQLQFIDDPRHAAERSQELVNDVVQGLADALTRQRDELDRWRGAQLDDTEELRVTVRRYRDLLDKLLAL